MSSFASFEPKPLTKRHVWQRSLIRTSILSLIAFISGCAFTPWGAREQYLASRATLLQGRDVSHLNALDAVPAQPVTASVAVAGESRTESPR